MRVFFYLSTCDTCKRILKQLPLPEDVVKIDIKKNPLTPSQLTTLYSHTASYEALLNKRAQLIKQRDLTIQELSENEIKGLLLEHYTFLKRPVLLFDEEIFIGNSTKTIAKALQFLNEQ